MCSDLTRQVCSQNLRDFNKNHCSLIFPKSKLYKPIISIFILCQCTIANCDVHIFLYLVNSCGIIKKIKSLVQCHRWVIQSFHVSTNVLNLICCSAGQALVFVTIHLQRGSLLRRRVFSVLAHSPYQQSLLLSILMNHRAEDQFVCLCLFELLMDQSNAAQGQKFRSKSWEQSLKGWQGILMILGTKCLYTEWKNWIWVKLITFLFREVCFCLIMPDASTEQTVQHCQNI